MNVKPVKAIVLGLLAWLSPKLEASNNELVVREWGTFTSIAGVDSQMLEWTPYRGGAELPGFVYGGKHNARGTVHMETPVIYFYTPKEMTCTVKVSFPQGEITEYYPMPDRLVYPVKALEWKGVELLPGREVTLPFRKDSNHYYQARATESVPLRVCKGNVIEEYEKFLFYRGVGSFAMPLSVEVFADKVTVRQAESGGIKEAILFENRNGKTSCLRRVAVVKRDGRPASA